VGLLDRALVIAQQNPDLTAPVMTYTAKARVLALAGRIGESRQLLEKALADAEHVGSFGYEAELRTEMAFLAKKSGNAPLALEQLQRAIDLGNQTSGPRLIAEASLEKAGIDRSLG